MSTTETIDPRIEERARALATAQEEQRLERLRQEAAAEIAAADAEAERQREIAQFTAELPERLMLAGVEKAEKAMIAAVERYVAAVHQRDLAFSEAGYFVAEHDCGQVTADALTVAGTAYRTVDPQRGITAAAMGRFYPRTFLTLDRY